MYRRVHPLVCMFVLASLLLTACHPIQARESIPSVMPANGAADGASPEAPDLQDLHSLDPAVRMAAAYQLGAAVENGSRAIPALIAATQDSDPNVRTVAAYALGKLIRADPALDPAASLAALDRALADADADVRYSAAHALGIIGAPATVLVPKLVAAMADASEDVRYAALAALAHIGPPESSIPQLIQALDAPNWYIRNAAAAALKTIPAAAAEPLASSLAGSTPAGPLATWRQNSAIVALLPTIGEPALTFLPQGFSRNTSGAQKALRSLALSHMGPAGIAILTQTVSNDDAESSQMALGVLGYQGLDALPAILQTFTITDGATPDYALNALAQIGPVALPTLSGILSDPHASSDEQQMAARALAAIGQPVATVRALLLAKATAAGVEPAVLATVITALAQLGPDAEPALPLFKTLARSAPTPQISAAAAMALTAVAPGDLTVVQTLQELLDDHFATPEVRAAAATALGASGPLAAAAVPALTSALQIEDPAIQNAAIDALAQIGPAAAAATPLIVELLDKTEHTKHAVTALGRLGPEALPWLIPHLSAADPPSFCTQPAAGAIKAMGRAAATPLMLTLLVEHEPARRAAELIMLACLESAATNTRGYLHLFLTDRDPMVSTAATLALDRIPMEASTLAAFAADALGSPQASARCAAAMGLLLLGQDAHAQQASLLAALSAPDVDVECPIAARKAAGPAHPSLAILSALTADAGPARTVQLRRLLRAALLMSGDLPPAAAEPLVAAFQDPVLRRRAAEATGSVGPAVSPGLQALIASGISEPALAEALAGKGSDIRRAALYALLFNDTARHAALPALHALAYEVQADPALRAMATLVLEKDGADVEALWSNLNQPAPQTIICPVWPEMKISADPNYDAYADYCAYAPGPQAPSIPQIAIDICRALGGCQ